MNTYINYVGKVKLFLNIGNKTIEIEQHNSGTAILQESICRFLAGQFRGNCDIPQYLDLRNSQNISMLLNVIPLNGRQFINSVEGIYARCDASILYSSLVSAIEADSSDYTLVLCADKDPDVPNGTYRDLAYMTVPSLSLSRISAGTSAAVEWRMYITNGGE